MNDPQFGQLCRDTCRHLDVAYADGDPGISEITVKGINISLIFDEEEAADRLFCYVDVGPIATANQAAAHHATAPPRRSCPTLASEARGVCGTRAGWS